MLFQHKKWFSFTKIKEFGRDEKKLSKFTRNLMGISSAGVNLPHFSSV